MPSPSDAVPPDAYDPGVIKLASGLVTKLETAETDPHVVFDPTGIYATDPGGLDTFRLNAALGSAYFRGAVASGSTVPATTVTGQLIDAQLAALATAKLVGQLTDAQ